jgi:gliding motility-associated-like protein
VDICEGFSATLLTGYDDSFDHDWNTNETTAEIVVDEAGLYSVTVSSPLGCEHTDDVTVILHTTPIVDLGPDQSLCEGQSTSLNAANPGADYLWSTNAQSQSISVSTDGNYSVEVEDQWGCIGNDTVFVVFNQNPEALLPDSEAICEDEVVTLDAGNSGSNYEWSTDQTSQTINVNVTGIYSVDITNIFGCTTTDQTELIVATYPVVDLGSDKAFCQGEFYTLDSESAGLNILWSTGEQTETITVSQSAYYTVTVDNGYCFTTDGASIVFNPLPIDALGNDSILCFITGGPQTLDAGNYGSLYLWNTGETTQQIEAESQGTYTVEVTTPLGCSLDFDIYFEEICEGILFIPNTFTPDNDGLNDAWFAYGTNVIDFDLQIWNRWGELIFESNDITKPWDGSVTNGDYYVESETYVYTVIYTYLREMDRKESDPVLLKGHITVIR